MSIIRSTSQPIQAGERDIARSEDLMRLRKAHAEGKASGDGETVRPDEFLKELKAERAGRG